MLLKGDERPGNRGGKWDFSGVPDGAPGVWERPFSLLCTCRYGCGDSALMFA